MKGRVHSIESFGTVDGPGIRLVVFMQGCPLRCLYCHNPDSWQLGAGKEYEPSEILAEYQRNAAFYKDGGITVSGGEPLLQLEFLSELFSLARERGIHTALDTSAITYRDDAEYLDRLDKVLANCNLVMLDIKHTDGSAHRRLTGASVDPVLRFLDHIGNMPLDVQIRRVIVKGYTDDPEELYSLGKIIGAYPSVKSLDVLPYHNMGVAKYRELGLDYPLGDMPSLEREYALLCRDHIIRGVKDARSQ